MRFSTTTGSQLSTSTETSKSVRSKILPARRSSYAWHRRRVRRGSGPSAAPTATMRRQFDVIPENPRLRKVETVRPVESPLGVRHVKFRLLSLKAP